MFVLDGGKNAQFQLQSNCVFPTNHVSEDTIVRINLLKAAMVLASVVAAVATSSQADAAQHTQIVNGKEVVVHTNPIPVVLHRLVPPQHGRHVTAREINAGSVPASGRIFGQRRK